MTDIRCSGSNTFFISSEGALFGTGSNRKGQLAQRPETKDDKIPRFVQIVLPLPISLLAVGWEHVLASNGTTLWSWGCNRWGQTGSIQRSGVESSPGTQVTNPTPIEFPWTLPITNLVAGLRHSGAIASGQLFMWGHAKFGQLGIPEPPDIQRGPQLVSIPGLATTAAAGWKHTIVLSGGRVYSFGDSQFGQLGRCQGESSLPGLVEFPDENQFVGVSCGATHSVAWSAEGRLYAFGRNNYGQLGISTTQVNEQLVVLLPFEGVDYACCGSEHSACRARSKNYLWGWNEHLQVSPGHCIFAEPQFVDNLDKLVLGGGHTVAW